MELGPARHICLGRAANRTPARDQANALTIRDSGAVLLDVSVDKKLETVIRDRLETKGDRVTDLHLWQVGPGHRAAVISVISDNPLPPATYKRRLKGLRGLSHVTIEVELCPP